MQGDYMSSCIKTKIECPLCGKKIDYDYWTTVNVDLDPSLKEKVFNRDLFRCHCSCGCNDEILHSLIYHNMKNNYMISFCTLTEVEDVKRSFQEIVKKGLIDETLRITTDYNEFLNKIAILDSGFDDKLIEIQKYIAFEGIKKKGKDVKDKITIFSAPDENSKDYYLSILDVSKTDDDDECFLFPIQRDWFEKHTQIINAKEKYIDEDFYVIDQAWANLIAGSGHYQRKNGYLRIINEHKNEVKQKYKVDYNEDDIDKIENYDTLLKLAVIADDYDRVKELLEKGANPNLQIEKGKIALHYALQYGVSKEIIALLINSGSDLNMSSKRGPKPLDVIYPDCSVEYLDYVMSLGAECNKKELLRHFASKTNKIEVIDYLVDKGFSLDERNNFDMNITAEVLCNNEDNCFLDKYLDKYGTPNEKYNGRPCIFNEVEEYDDIRRVNGYYAKRLQILFSHGADVNIANNRNQTLMMHACLFAHSADTIKFLLTYKPDLLSVDEEGKDVFDYLNKNDSLSNMEKEIITFLIVKNRK